MGRIRWGSIRIALLAILVLAMPMAVFPQGFQVGSITGTITDQSGGVLPGVTVTVTSQDRGTVRSTTTDSAGRFMMQALQLGMYTVQADLSGFQSQALKNNKVEADKATDLTVALKLSSTAEVITVTGQQPVVDRTNVSANTHLSVKEYEKAPVGRSYQSLMTFTPGVVDQPGNGSAGNPQVHGATSANNVYLFDGVDTTDTVTGTFGANLNFEAIQEIAVYTAGASAEYGRATGAVLNVVTKSGTNQFEGSAKSIQTNDKWNAQNKTHSTLPPFASNARTRINHNNYRYTYTLGGPFWKDHLWFFGAYETAKTVSAAAQTTVSRENYVANQVLTLPNYRVTAQLTPTQNIWAKYSADPFTGIIRDYWGGAPELFSLTAQGQGGKTKTAQYSGVFGQSFTAEALYAESTSTITVAPYLLSPLNNGAPHFNNADQKYYNGATFDGMVARPRKQFVVAGSYFATLGGNSHNLKAGIDAQEQKSTNLFKYPNSQLFIDDTFNYMTRAFTPSQRLDFIDGPSTSKGNITAFYVRDKFDIGRRLFMEAGLRFEKETGKNDLGDKVVDAHDVAPRLQMSYDLTGDGRNILGGTLGRFYDSITQNFADQYAGVPQQTNYDEFTYDPVTKTYVKTASVRAGGTDLPKALNLKAPHMDEVTLSFQRQLGPTIGVGVRGIHRKWADLTDDILGITAAGGKTLSYTNLGAAKRSYEGVEFTFDKRFSQNWNLLANYTYSRTRGNHFGQLVSQIGDYQNATCRSAVDPTLGTAFSANGSYFPCAAANATAEGKPTYDLPHLFNMTGTYTHSFGRVNLTAGTSGIISSGSSYSATRTVQVVKTGADPTLASSASTQTVTYFYGGRGAYRNPTWYQLDGSLEATMKFFGFEIGAKGEAFNMTDSQKARVVSATAYCANAAAAAGTTCANSRAAFGSYTTRGAFQGPRSFRLTGLIRF
jgi:Carboxypeptidase regulatory-like domain/TonB-dependent Receptor Plug Domain